MPVADRHWNRMLRLYEGLLKEYVKFLEGTASDFGWPQGSSEMIVELEALWKKRAWAIVEKAEKEDALSK